MTELRPYQKIIYDHVISNNYDIECIGAATGSGKTICFAHITKYYRTIGKNIIIIVNRDELLFQTRRELHKLDIIPVTLKSNQKQKPIGTTMIAMAETLFRRLNKWSFKEYDIAIVDECHIGQYFKLLDSFKKVIGFTATPLYIKKGKSLEDYYKRLFFPVQTKELIDLGYLARPVTYVPSNMVQSFKTTMGDYDEKQQSEELVKFKYIDTVVKYWNERKDKNTLVFNVSIEHSITVEAALKEAGANVIHIDGGTDKDQRAEIRNRLKNEKGLWVCNVGVLTFGFDSDEISCIMINCKTKSVAKYNQMCGRGSRAGLYDTFEILDMHGSCIECGTWDEEKNWQYLFAKKKSDKIGVSPIKFCPKCEAVLQLNAKNCAYCGYEYVIEEIKKVIYLDDDPNLTEYQRKIKSDTKTLINLSLERGHNQYKPLREMIVKELNNASNEGRSAEFDYIVSSFCDLMGWSKGRQWWIKTEYIKGIIEQRKSENQSLINSIR